MRTKEATGHRSRRRPTRMGVAALAALGLLSVGSPICGPNAGCPDDFVPVTLPHFLFGFSQTPAEANSMALEIGAQYLRPTLSWRVVEPNVQVTGLTRAAVQADPTIVSQWAATRDWSAFDARLGDIADDGLTSIPIVGHGYTNTLPLLAGIPAAPDVLGREEYLARQYVFTRAVVERYDGDGIDDAPSGLRIDIWQTENELNQAFFTAIFGWRHPNFFAALGSAWMDFDYMTQLLRTLRTAVKDADPSALTTMNFHTDVGKGINYYFRQPGWENSIVLWRMDIDIVSFDAYPNYYRSTPPDGNTVGERARGIRDLSCGMPVVVMETGYPSGPSVEGFDEQKQATFIRDAFDSSVAAGVDGFLLFGAKTSETHVADITAEDIATLELLATWFETGDAQALLTYALNNLDYLQTHFVNVIQAVEGYWGLYRADGSEKPSMQVMRDIGASLPQ